MAEENIAIQNLGDAAAANLNAALDALAAAGNYTTAYNHKAKWSNRGHELTTEIEDLLQKLGIPEAARIKARGEVAIADGIMGPNLATVIAQDRIIAMTDADIEKVLMVVAAGFKGTVYSSTVEIQGSLYQCGVFSTLSLNEH